MKTMKTLKKKIQLICLSEAYQKMFALVDMAKKEIGWHMVVTKEDEETYIIQDILVYPQEVTGVTTKATSELDGWMMNLPDESFNNLRGQGHSHVNMSASPSQTDQNYYNKLINQIDDFYVYMIVNKQRDVWIELYDVKEQLIYESQDIVIDWQYSEHEEWALEQIETQVSEKKYNAYNYDYKTGKYKSKTKSKTKKSELDDYFNANQTILNELEKDWRY